MRVVIVGSSGLIGTAVRRSFQQDGHSVLRLVRRPPQSADEVQWDPGHADPSLVDGADVVIGLAGAPLGDHRWNAHSREIIASSRIQTAAALAAMTAAATRPPTTLISMSGIRFYGVDRGDEVLTERSGPRSDGFLPRLTADWEAATSPATEAGVRVSHLRTGLVLSRQGGVLPQLLPYFRAGFGATLGSGRQFWSYLTLTDTVGAIRFLAEHPTAQGPYNLTTAEPVRSAGFTRALGRAVGRPTLLRVPLWALRAGMGQVAPEVLGSLRVLPERLLDAGFHFQHPDIETALNAALAEGLAAPT
jgi:uncharacterized protein (TIGR01777 family)